MPSLLGCLLTTITQNGDKHGCTEKNRRQKKIELIQKALAADKHRDWGLLVHLAQMELLLLGMEHRHEGGYNYKDEDLLAMWNKWNELDQAARDRNKLVELINGVAFEGPDHIAEAEKLPNVE